MLDGRPFESLVSTTFEGLKIAPLYPRVTNEGTRALRQKPGAWKISQRMDHPEPETANPMARADLIGGADALTLTVSQAHAARGFGVRVDGERDLDAAFAGIDLDLISLRIDAGARALDIAPAFASMARNRSLTSASSMLISAMIRLGISRGRAFCPPGAAWRRCTNSCATRASLGTCFSPMGGLITKQARGKPKNLGA